MMTCRQATELISRELDINLPLRQRMGLRFHSLLCRTCRRFRGQIATVDAAVTEFFSASGFGGPATKLPTATKESLKAMISVRLDAES